MIKEVKKPWGNFQQFVFNKKCTVKILNVKPKQKLSLQYHKNRKELWFFLSDGYAIIGKKVMKVKKGRLITVNKRVPHRLFSKGKNVQVLEISLGNFDENDIVRLEDEYGRK